MEKKYNTAVIIQARMGSTRLPGKILFDLVGKTVLERVIERVQKSKLIDGVIVATTNLPEDDKVKKLCAKIGVPIFRGSEKDVLDRYYQTAKQFHVKHIVRITSDCPLIDATVIDQVIQLYTKSRVDYASNILKETFPDGEDTEVFSFVCLGVAWKNAILPSEREHVTPYIRHHPKVFRLKNLTHTPNLSHFRWTLDEKRDYLFLKKVYEKLEYNNSYFTMNDILAILTSNPKLQNINANIIRNKGYLKSLDEDFKFKKVSITKTQSTYRKAKTLIPGGTQLLSKRPEMFAPNQWPAYYERAKGCDIWDLDGKKYKDMSYMGIGANIIGYADTDINTAVVN